MQVVEKVFAYIDILIAVFLGKATKKKALATNKLT